MKYATKLIPALALAAALSGCADQPRQSSEGGGKQIVNSDGSCANGQRRHYRNPYLQARRIGRSICKGDK